MAQEEEDAQEVNPSLGLTGSQTAAATVAVDPRGGIPLMLNGPARPSMLMEVEKSVGAAGMLASAGNLRSVTHTN